MEPFCASRQIAAFNQRQLTIPALVISGASGNRRFREVLAQIHSTHRPMRVCVTARLVLISLLRENRNFEAPT
jgi:hypothetical protein